MVAARVDRLAVHLAEDEVVVLPDRAGRHTLGELCRPVSPKRVTKRRGESDRPTASTGLRLDEHQTLARLALRGLTHRERARIEVDRSSPSLRAAGLRAFETGYFPLPISPMSW
jgi:hypothetical protein